MSLLRLQHPDSTVTLFQRYVDEDDDVDDGDDDDDDGNDDDDGDDENDEDEDDNVVTFSIFYDDADADDE
jgi:hypothetical protein